MIRIKIIIATALASLAIVPAFAADGGLPTQKVLTIALANEAATAALNSCTASGYKVTVVVVDRHGDARLMLVGDGTRPNNDTARRKAYTSAIRGISSAEYAKQMAARPPQPPGSGPAPDPSLILAAGALPIIVGGDLIAAIGVGGAPGGDKDEACAAAGLEKIKDRLK